MDIEPPILDRHGRRGVREREGDGVAIWLELLPIASIPILLLGLAVQEWSFFWLAWAPLLASGAGWWRVGRHRLACSLAVTRAVVVAVAAIATVWFALIWALWCLGVENGDCDSPAWNGWVALFSLTVFVVTSTLVPIASAIMVARASRIR